jgi:hypothetical protein
VPAPHGWARADRNTRESWLSNFNFLKNLCNFLIIHAHSSKLMQFHDHSYNKCGVVTHHRMAAICC